jgi:aspartyl/asparaginyl beta-hydroxylase (cupin superfamily)
VGNSVREWHPGQAFVFDDTIEHEAWNDSDQLRVVLIVDLWPPGLSEGTRRTIAALVGALGVSFQGT